MPIRVERAEDAAAVAELTAAAFGDEREARMVAALRASEGFVPELALVAEDEQGDVVGHVLVTYVGLAGSGRRLLELGPLSVRPDRQRQGHGSALVREALTRAEQLSEPVVLVLGHASYYTRFGFRPASQLGLGAPDERIPDEAWMALPLAAYDPALRGTVVFPAAYAVD